MEKIKKTYYCNKCKKRHFISSTIGKKHQKSSNLQKRAPIKKTITSNKQKLVIGILKEGQKQYGHSHTGFVGKSQLQEMLQNKSIPIKRVTMISYLNNITKEDWVQDDIQGRYASIREFYNKFKPLSTYDSIYAFDPKTGKTLFFGEDTIVLKKIENFYKNNRGKYLVLFSVEAANIILLPQFGDKNKLNVSKIISAHRMQRSKRSESEIYMDIIVKKMSHKLTPKEQK